MPAPANSFASSINAMAEHLPTPSPTLGTSVCPWIDLRLPACTQALAPLQALLGTQANALGFAHSAQQRILAACEEALQTILLLSHDASADADNTLQVYLETENNALVLRLSDNGLPYDTSLLPHYDPRQAERADADTSGLASFLMHKLSDRCQVINQGSRGHHIQLEWLLPEAPTSMHGSAPTDAAGQRSHSAQDTTHHDAESAPTPQTAYIRPLQPSDAIHLARLMYRSYGYSYVNPDMYVAERILARVNDGRLTSWVAATQDEQGHETIVGHIACMKGHRDDDTLEVGTAVVAPSQRGTGLLGRLLSTTTEALEQRSEHAAFVHAVTAHPFTQKTFGRLGYLPTALLLAYTPASLRFRSISRSGDSERGSVYYACKLLKPMAPLPVFVPPALADMILQRAQDIQLPLLPQPAPTQPLHGSTQLSVQVEDALNAAFLTLHQAGADLAQVLPRQLRSLCRAQVAAIYLSLDLSHSSTPEATEQALAHGFIPAGLTPFMPWPATLCLQYLNNQQLHEEQVCAVSPAAHALRRDIFAAYRAQEWIDTPAA